VLCCGAIAAERRRLLSINIFIPPGSQQQTRRTPLLLTVDGTGGWTDGRTDTRPFRRPCSAYYVGTINKMGTVSLEE